MDTRRHWIGFDWLKLIVAIILLLLLLVLLLQKPAVPPPSTGNANEVGMTAASPTPLLPTAVPQTATQPQPSLTPTTVLPTATLPPAPTPTQVPPTATPAPTEVQPTATPKAEAAAAATATATAEAAPTATPQPASAAGDCPLAQPSRLAVGKQAQVLANLNLRKAAGMDQSILRVSLPASKVDIIGGPICIPYQKGAYLWWNIKTADGVTGWSAEASLSKNFYFLQPVP